MIKGINRQVVEVSETGCEYFEKIMFFVKPEYISISESKIRESASTIAGKASPAPATRQGARRYFGVAKTIFAALCGAAAMLILSRILN